MASKKPRIRLHPEVLNNHQRIVLSRLGPVMSAMGFSLAGGTALAMHLGHRRSINFDWFTGKRIPDALRLAQTIRRRSIPLKVKLIDQGTLAASISGVRTAFFEYRYPMLKAGTYVESYGCTLASLDDIACMKLSAVAQRGTKKDFVDIFALLEAHTTLNRMLTLYKRKYSTGDILPVLRALAFFDDADTARMPTMLWNEEWPAIKARIRKAIRRVAKSV